MLVLARKVGQRVLIGDSIVVCLIAIGGKNSARIGIDAPAEVLIEREEVVKRRVDGELAKEPGESN